MKKKVLITTFEPFAEFDKNSSQAVADLYQNNANDAYDVTLLTLPVIYEDAMHIVEDHIKQNYDLVLLFGMAADRDKITVERFAINLKDSKTADNSGYIAIDEKIVAQGDLALESTINWKSILKSLSAMTLTTSSLRNLNQQKRLYAWLNLI